MRKQTMRLQVENNSTMFVTANGQITRILICP